MEFFVLGDNIIQQIVNQSNKKIQTIEFKNNFYTREYCEMETTHTTNQIITRTFGDKELNEQTISENQLVYQNFATKPTDSFLGISVQKERLYVIQKKSIGVFEYFIQNDNQMILKGPIMIKEIFLPFQITKYIITEKYICIKSKHKTQIRDSEFERVFYSDNKGIITSRSKDQNENQTNPFNFSYDSVEQLELESEIIEDEMVSWKVLMKRKTSQQKYLREYWSQKYHITNKHRSVIKCRSEMIDPTTKNRKLQICKPPLFLNQLGYIQNFYIWPISSSDIQIGIYFNQKQSKNLTQNSFYQICSFQLKDTNIKNIFYYDFKITNHNNNSKDGPHLFLSVCQNQNQNNQKIKIVIFQILPQQNIEHGDENQNQALNSYLDQFNQLQKSLSNSLLLNELLNNQQQPQSHSNPNKPTTIMQSFTIKNSSNLKRVFFNPITKVLWINDTSNLVYRVKLAQQGNLKEIRQNSYSFIQSLEGYQNGEVGPDLEGVMYDEFPIFKVKAYALEMGVRRKSPNLSINQTKLNLQTSSKPSSPLNPNTSNPQKQVIEFNDQQLLQLQIINNQSPINDQPLLTNNYQHQMRQYQTQTIKQQLLENYNEKNIDKKEKEYVEIQTQTDNELIINVQTTQMEINQNRKQKQIAINDLSELLQQLNFNKVQDVLIRFSTIFTAQITKNVNKLKEFNQKAKEQIKLKINGQIFQLLQQVFSSLINDTLCEKIEKQVVKAREFVQKIFNKQIEHFNLMILQEKVKEEYIKKSIIQEQLRSMDTIKEASMKFLDVTKVREMQKIAHNQIVIQNFKQVGKQIQNLQIKVDEMMKSSQEIEKNIMSEVKEIKDTFKLLIELQESESQDEEEKIVEQEDSESGFESGEEEEESQDDQNQRFQPKKVYPYQQGYHYQRQRIPPQQMYVDRIPGWTTSSFYEGPPKYFYPNNMQITPGSSIPPQHPSFYQPFPHSYPPQPNPYLSHIQPNQPQYFPPPNPIHPSFSEIKQEQKRISDLVKEKKKKTKLSSKLSSTLKNQ